MRRWVVLFALVLVGLPSAASPVGTPAGEIAFLGTLPSWPPPENLDATRFYSAGIAGQPRQRLDADAVGGVGMASLSPDRRWIAVVRTSEPHGDSKGLWLVNADGSGERRLLSEQAQESFAEEFSFLPPAWSPDGRLLAVNAVSTASCGSSSTKCATWAVVVVDTSGRRVVTIDGGRNASWAPDSRRVVVEQGRDGGFSLSPETTTIDVVRLGATKAGRTVSGRIRHTGEYSCFFAPFWSPDGRTIAFAEGDCNTLEPTLLHVVAAADGRRLRSSPGVFGDWSQDGSKLLFSGNSDAAPIYVVARDGSGLRRLAPRSSGPAAWSRDGRRVLFVGAGKGMPIFSVGADGRGLRRLVAASGGSFLVAPTRPLVAFTLPNGRDLGVVASTGASIRVVSRQPEPWCVGPFGWSADGVRLLFTGVSATLPDLALWVMRVDGTAGQLLARRVSAPEEGRPPTTFWSPDGKWLAYRTSSGLNVIGRDGQGAHAVAPAPVYGFSWAPDSTRLAYVDDSVISVAQRDGSGRRKLVPGAGSPAWSPTGEWIAYVTTSGIGIVRPDGAGGRILVPRTADTVPGSPVWSPDGKQLAYTWAGTVEVVALDTGTVRTVEPRPATDGHGTQGFCDTPIWSPDGTTLAAPCEGLRAIRADGTGSRLLVQAAQGSSIELGSWSPDSRFVAYSGVSAVGVDGGNPVRITTFNARSVAPSWAPE